jgi:UDP:flavonoid glycosyltransferase YjiC (YdhE family)
MARIVFTWELGEGMGHIAPYVSIIRGLQAKRHEVFFILKDLRQASSLLAAYPITCFQAPIKIWPTVNPIKTALTYAHILHNIGFDHRDSLARLVEGWRALFNTIKPDVTIFEHSPTALLAARGYSFKKILLETGFVIPPPVYPLPNLRFWVKPDPAALRDDEDRTLDIMNGVLDKFQLEPLDRITDLFSTDAPPILTTFKELDPYGERENGQYYGAWTNPIGEDPIWPAGDGKKVFAYLKSFPALPVLLAMLDKLKIPCIIYSERIPQTLQDKFSSPALKFVTTPQDMSRVALQCDCALLNGTHNTSTHMLLAGKPALHLPIFLEQTLTAHKIENLGAGVSAHTLKPDEIAAKLDLLLFKSDSYIEAARGFAERYRHRDPRQENERIVTVIESMLA